MELILGRVMVFGTFDVFHPGHEFFIAEAIKQVRPLKKTGVWSSEFGEKRLRTPNSKLRTDLIVVVARDKTVKRLKQLLRNPEAVRLSVLQEAFPEVEVVLGDEQDPMKAVQTYRPSLVCLGYDQVGFSEQLQRDFPEIAIKRIRAHKPEQYKSSKME